MTDSVVTRLKAYHLTDDEGNEEVLSPVTHAKPVPLVICDVFGRYCDQALRVSWCESRWSPRARNGQYLGIFQMGSWERSRFGHGRDAYSQARAA